MLADEATDCSNVEQMAIVLRFVDGLFQIREESLGFVACQKVCLEKFWQRKLLIISKVLGYVWMTVVVKGRKYG